jgi:NADH-quinone oxidoreductase subunit N
MSAVQEILAVAPVVLIGLLATAVMVVDALIRRSARLSFWLSVVGLLGVAAAAVWTLPASGTVLSGLLSRGGMAALFDIVFAAAGVLTLLAARPYLEREGREYDEFYALLLFALAGAIILAHAAHLVVFFLGIELLSVSFYVLAGYFRTQPRSVEAALKYFLLGAFATGFLLYGIAMVYGSTGAMGYESIAARLQQGSPLQCFWGLGSGCSW